MRLLEQMRLMDATGGMHRVANLAIFLKKPPSLSTFFESVWVSVAD